MNKQQITGERLKGANCKHAGIITHLVSEESLPEIEEQLCMLPPGIDKTHITNLGLGFLYT